MKQHRAHGERVRARVQHIQPAARLFWWHERRRAEHRAIHRQALIRLLDVRHAEVEQFDDSLARDVDVGWLEIAVDHFLGVARGQPCQELLRDAQRVPRAELAALAGQKLIERQAVEHLHGHVELSVIARPDVVDLDHVLVVDAHGHFRLALEARAYLLVRLVALVEGLERGEALPVSRCIYGRCGAKSEESLELPTPHHRADASLRLDLEPSAQAVLT